MARPKKGHKKLAEPVEKAGPSLPPFAPPTSNRLLVETGCYVCGKRVYVRIDPFAGGNQFACECGAQNLVLLRPFTVAFVKAVTE